jgi:hypothetical protein
MVGLSRSCGNKSHADHRHSEIHNGDYVGGEKLPRRGSDNLAESVQFGVLRGTYYGATCPGDLSTWQKSARSANPCSAGQLPGSFSKVAE